MILILYTILTVFLVFSTANIFIFIALILLSIANIILKKTPINSMFKKLLVVLPVYSTLLILYMFFFKEGKIVLLFDTLKIYNDGIKKGFDFFLRGMSASFFIFSLNISKIKDEILYEIRELFKNIRIVFRFFNLLFMGIYFVEKLFEKFIHDKRKWKIFKIADFLKESLVDFEDDFKNNNKILNRVKKKIFIKSDFILLVLVCILLISNLISGGFFARLF